MMMRLRGVAPWVGLTIVLAVCFHLLTVWLLPRVIMELVQFGAGPANAMLHREPVTAAHRDIVRQSPDLLYASCAFDVSDKPLLITATKPDGYFSISMFTTNTDNFFAINDLSMPEDEVRLVLVREGATYAAREGEKVVRAPTTRGLVLLRMLVRDRARIDDLVAVQKQASCRPVD
jgi:uncharacterized membrane protein